jgi:hypothetical protein
VVLICTACEHTWEPDLLDPTDRSEAFSTSCPRCGGGTWIGEVTEPGDESASPTTTPKEDNAMETLATADNSVDGLPGVLAMVDAGLRRLDVERQRACQLLADAPKCRRLSSLYERETRLWVLLTQHTRDSVYLRAVIEAQCAARSRAHEYAELARCCAANPRRADQVSPEGAS